MDEAEKKELQKRLDKILEKSSDCPRSYEIDLRIDVINFITRRMKKSVASYAETAKRVKIRPDVLGRILNGKENITIEDVANIYYAFGSKPKIVAHKVNKK